MFKIDYKKTLKFLASIKMAVIVIASIAILTAIGTFVEAKYDATAAKKLVYDSIYMNIIMVVFAINLTAVMVDRWPWKIRHIPFICAHIGILILMLGQFLTSKIGVDGTLRVEIGGQSRLVQLPQTDLILYSSFDGNNYTKIIEREVDFFRNPPTVEKPMVLLPDQADIKIKNHYRYALASKEIQASDNKKLGAGVRIQITNGQANFIEWIVQRNPYTKANVDLGPLKVHLGLLPESGKGLNEIYLQAMDNGKIKYMLFDKSSLDPKFTGELEEGKSMATGWMGLELRILRFFPQAQENWKIEKRDFPTPLTSEALEVEYKGKSQWILLNDTVKFFTDNAVYFLTYANRRMDLGFNVQLKNFIVDKYQGTMRAMAYKSQVQIEGYGEHEISMNEPLKYQGLTIYQASFQDGPMGNPVASIFSINKDPGRWLKYLGSLIMTLGIILLFYFKKMGIGQKKGS
ncbi:MAG: cytochrome c biogenesis protein ResB [Bdellovibrionaceae bacterium]|nr:cytochrome c biogenesis protein ResB [Pseudobdellovibrionaceae bacterium]NUM58418.1 cytochrome c biogenesis protein ResB [Pseudobdellovibrionaceae bacterium]